MRVLFLLFLCVILCEKVFPQLVIKVYKDTALLFSYAGGDEFNQRELDERKWKNGIGGRRVLIGQDLVFEPNNVKFSEGLIQFIANHRDSTYNLTIGEVDSSFLKRKKIELLELKWLTRYSAGAIVSREKHHYGLYELRFKVEEGKGIWPAFWFYGGKKNEEIDVFELKGERNNEIHVDTHCPSGCAHGYKKTKFSFGASYGGWIPLSRFLHDGFNDMMFEWTEKELIWYINGYPLAYYRGNFANPMNLYLNTSVAKSGEAFGPGPDESTGWPNTYSVDYLRIWQPIASGAVPELTVNENLRDCDAFPPDYSGKPKKKRGLMYSKNKLNPIEGMIVLTAPQKGKINVKVLGLLSESDQMITIKGNATSIIVDPRKKEITVDIDPHEKVLVLEFSNGHRQFIQPVRLK